MKGSCVKYLILFFKALTALILLIVILALLGAAFSNIPSGKDWVDVMSALLTPVIGLSALVISWRQYEIKKQEKTQFEFDKKWEVYRNIGTKFSKLRTFKKDEHSEFKHVFDLLLIDARQSSFVYSLDVSESVHDEFARMAKFLEDEVSNGTEEIDLSESLKTCETSVRRILLKNL